MLPKVKRKAEVVKNHCVACGVCANVCPKDASTIYRGIYAVVNEELCVGCSKCSKACPAGTIRMIEREVSQ
ncbi:ATP-binding protein [Lachnoclostridium phytofermentans]|uniref:4Fe-4S ferredoxin iron-sulfur binding domain protein n=1 Tax=Lachnoclostridium phytofermentans (strain ATCC 700394 / DSM 18823 / ISDg) TaxID=357809 RepID=A9KHC3_LACP7|nr:4Fe-4S binding protein [Lachnoclostridium phytofermentans]ABX40790.1 4Fe-4S ferredoxin iron-sulfur binding domain protein [Lachnoclostridium phytofermentans ISDg]